MLSQNKHPKFGIPVRITMADKTHIMGLVFVHQGQRVLDVLCDARGFIPIKTTAGVRLINKAYTVEINLLEIEEMMEKRDLFPSIDFNYLQNNSW
jgi:hypothetical protein